MISYIGKRSGFGSPIGLAKARALSFQATPRVPSSPACREAVLAPTVSIFQFALANLLALSPSRLRCSGVALAPWRRLPRRRSIRRLRAVPSRAADCRAQGVLYRAAAIVNNYGSARVNADNPQARCFGRRDGTFDLRLSETSLSCHSCFSRANADFWQSTVAKNPSANRTGLTISPSSRLCRWVRSSEHGFWDLAFNFCVLQVRESGNFLEASLRLSYFPVLQVRES